MKKLVAALQAQLQDMIDLLKKHGISEKEIMGMLQKSGLAGSERLRALALAGTV